MIQYQIMATLTCPICYMTMDDPMVSKSRHTICRSCFQTICDRAHTTGQRPISPFTRTPMDNT